MSTKLPDVSIIMPVYNMDKYITQAVKSVLNQKNVSFELVIVDDASTDSSLKIAKELAATDSRIVIVELEHNCGSGLARNVGLAKARGTYVRFLDPDDYYPKDSLSKLVTFANTHFANLVAGNIASLNANSGAMYRKENKFFIKEDGSSSFDENPVFWVPLHHHRYLFRREFLEQYGIVYPDLKRGQDPVMLAMALTRAKKIYYIKDLVYVHRIFPGKTDTFSADKLVDLIYHFQQVIEIYKEAGNIKYGYLHLLNRLGFLFDLDYSQKNSDELAQISKALKKMCDTIDLQNLSSSDFIPYTVNSAWLWFLFALIGKSDDEIARILIDHPPSQRIVPKGKKYAVYELIKSNSLLYQGIRGFMRMLPF